MSDLYDADILEWSERQAALLRRIAAGERINTAELDWPNIIEEVESVGNEQLHAVESLLVQLLIHRLKLMAWPQSLAVRGWEKEVRVFGLQVRRRYAPSMRQRLDLPGLYEEALLSLPETLDERAPLPIPAACPFALDDLLAGE